MTWLQDAAAIDELMFLPNRWFALSSGNQQVPRVVVPSLSDGLGLVDTSPRVASIVGTLRPEFVVIDIDVDDARGRSVMTELESWTRGQGLWHLVRPSGGAPGRFHIYIRHDDREQVVRARAAKIRTREGLPTKAIDVRRIVRPLSAPHRLGAHPRPLGMLRRALAGLLSVAEPSRGASATGDQTVRSSPRARRTEPLINGVRGRRPLPLEWARYLTTGEEPPLQGDDGPSTYGARITAELVRAGYQAEEAWAKIASAHRNACTHARKIGHGRDWWIEYQWNPAVEDLRRFRLEHGIDTAAQLDPDADLVAAAVQVGRAALEVLQWRWGPRARVGIVLVAHTLMDRMLRENSTTVPCPQRDLESDTGLCRPTIAKALRSLHDVLGTLHETFDPAQRERSSHTFALAGVDELRDVVDESHAGEERVGQDLPPVLHTPTPPGLWPLLGSTAHALWRTLQTAPVTLEVAVVRSGLTHGPGQAPTVDQLRTATRHLTALAQAGMAQCDDAGRWSLAAARKAHTPERTARAHAAVEPIQARVAAERAAYRTAPGYTWRRARAESIELERIKAAGRYERWRQNLTKEEYVARSRGHAARFASLSPEEQARLKDVFVHRRAARLGPSEAHRHDTWCRSLSDLDYADRAAERQHRYSQLHPIEQAHRAQMWAEHRRRWDIPRGHPDEVAGSDVGHLRADSRPAAVLVGAPS